MVSNVALAIDNIQGGPVMIVEGIPDFVLRVDRDGVGDGLFLHGQPDVLEFLLKTEFRCMNPDNYQPAIAVPVCPRSQIRKGASPVNAGVSPKVDDHHFSAQLIWS